MPVLVNAMTTPTFKGCHTLVLFHNDCTDGYISALVAWLHFGDSADYFPIEADLLSNVSGLLSIPSYANKEVYLLDVSAAPTVVLAMRANGAKVTILDHHKSSQEQWDSEADKAVVVYAGQSGAMMSWNYFFPGVALPRLIAYVSDYDLQEMQLHGCLEFNAALRNLMPWSFEKLARVLKGLGNVGSADTSLLTAMQFEGLALRTQLQAYAHQLLALSHPLTLPGLGLGLCVNAPAIFANDVAAIALAAGVPFIACWHSRTPGEVRVSLRGGKQGAVHAYAEKHGGGGHEFSAGFKLDHATWFELLNESGVNTTNNPCISSSKLAIHKPSLSCCNH